MDALKAWEHANKAEQVKIRRQIAEEQSMVDYQAQQGDTEWYRRYPNSYWTRVDKWWWPGKCYKPLPKLQAIADHFRSLGYTVVLEPPDGWADGKLRISWAV